jgi:Fe-S oxidoreductase
MRALPMLQARRAALETCVFCPKLCRSACPVSNAEPRETITPWGKMSFAWMGAHGDVPLDDAHAAPAWACTECYACSEACQHRNPVADVLLDVRDAFARAGRSPGGAKRVVEGFARHDAETRSAARALQTHPAVHAGASEGLLVGCQYIRHAAKEARDAIDAATALSGAPVALVEGCCGLPLLLAGDKAGFARHAAGVARSVRMYGRVTVVDAGCALALRRRYAEAAIEGLPPLELLVEHAARALPRLRHVPHEGLVRWHDPCQLGRGLGIYDAPRAVLTRILGRAPVEFHDRREGAACSGAGGLLPSTMPDVARAIAAARVEAHLEQNRGVEAAETTTMAQGGSIVTACASSLLALRRAAHPLGVAVDDLMSFLARAVRST